MELSEPVSCKKCKYRERVYDERCKTCKTKCSTIQSGHYGHCSSKYDRRDENKPEKHRPDLGYMDFRAKERTNYLTVDGNGNDCRKRMYDERCKICKIKCSAVKSEQCGHCSNNYDRRDENKPEKERLDIGYGDCSDKERANYLTVDGNASECIEEERRNDHDRLACKGHKGDKRSTYWREAKTDSYPRGRRRSREMCSVSHNYTKFRWTTCRYSGSRSRHGGSWSRSRSRSRSRRSRNGSRSRRSMSRGRRSRSRSRSRRNMSRSRSRRNMSRRNMSRNRNRNRSKSREISRSSHEESSCGIIDGLRLKCSSKINCDSFTSIDEAEKRRQMLHSACRSHSFLERNSYVTKHIYCQCGHGSITCCCNIRSCHGRKRKHKLFSSDSDEDTLKVGSTSDCGQQEHGHGCHGQIPSSQFDVHWGMPCKESLFCPDGAVNPKCNKFIPERICVWDASGSPCAGYHVQSQVFCDSAHVKTISIPKQGSSDIYGEKDKLWPSCAGAKADCDAGKTEYQEDQDQWLELSLNTLQRSELKVEGASKNDLKLSFPDGISELNMQGPCGLPDIALRSSRESIKHNCGNELPLESSDVCFSVCSPNVKPFSLIQTMEESITCLSFMKAPAVPSNLNPSESIVNISAGTIPLIVDNKSVSNLDQNYHYSHTTTRQQECTVPVESNLGSSGISEFEHHPISDHAVLPNENNGFPPTLSISPHKEERTVLCAGESQLKATSTADAADCGIGNECNASELLQSEKTKEFSGSVIIVDDSEDDFSEQSSFHEFHKKHKLVGRSGNIFVPKEISHDGKEDPLHENKDSCIQGKSLARNILYSGLEVFDLEYRSASLENAKRKDEVENGMNCRGISFSQSYKSTDECSGSAEELAEDKCRTIEVISSEGESIDNNAYKVTFPWKNGTLQEFLKKKKLVGSSGNILVPKEISHDGREDPLDENKDSCIQGTSLARNILCSGMKVFDLEYRSASLENAERKDEVENGVNFRGLSFPQSYENTDECAGSAEELAEDKCRTIEVISSEGESVDNNEYNVTLPRKNRTLQESGCATFHEENDTCEVADSCNDVSLGDVRLHKKLEFCREDENGNNEAVCSSRGISSTLDPKHLDLQYVEALIQIANSKPRLWDTGILCDLCGGGPSLIYGEWYAWCCGYRLCYCKCTKDHQRKLKFSLNPKNKKPSKRWSGHQWSGKVHRLCGLWSSEVFEKDDGKDKLEGLLDAVKRGKKVDCKDPECRRYGATLGCRVKNCRRSFHYPCAVKLASQLRCRIWEGCRRPVACYSHRHVDYDCVSAKEWQSNWGYGNKLVDPGKRNRNAAIYSEARRPHQNMPDNILIIQDFNPNNVDQETTEENERRNASGRKDKFVNQIYKGNRLERDGATLSRIVLDTNTLQFLGQNLICEDLSHGKEAIKIPCTNDIDDAPVPSLEYITSSRFSADADAILKTVLANVKNQAKPCSGCYEIDMDDPKACVSVHVDVNGGGRDQDRRIDWQGEPMLGRFPYDHYGLLQLGWLTIDIVECNSRCCCGSKCVNGELQKGLQLAVEVFKTQDRGWGVRTLEQIPRGKFVMEYVGEVLTQVEAGKRGQLNAEYNSSYLFNLDHPAVAQENHLVLDGFKMSNVARFINHSCEGNLRIYRVYTETLDPRIFRIGLYACRDIEIGEELTYDYKFIQEEPPVVSADEPSVVKCFCRAKNCRQVLLSAGI